MLKKIKEYIFVKRLDPEIEKRIDADNLFFCQLMCICVMILEVIMLIAYGYFGDRSAVWYTLRVWCYSSYFLFSAVCYWLARVVSQKEASHNAITIVGLSCCAAAIIWGMVISATDYMNGKQVFVFITNVVCVAGFAFIKPLIAIPFFTSLFTVFYCILVFACGVQPSFPVNLAILLLMIILTSITRYHTKLSDTKARVEFEKLNRMLQKISLYDELTGVKNRHSLSQDVQGFLNKSLFLMLIDIDDFKPMNDTFGHDYGDQQLIRFSQVLQKVFFQQNVYRYGGDEFIVAVCDCNHDVLTHKIEQCQLDAANLVTEAPNQKITFSGGYTIQIPNDKAAFDAMIQSTDKALYASKNRGKSQITYAD